MSFDGYRDDGGVKIARENRAAARDFQSNRFFIF
jgi:hypothetical protein